MCCLVLAVGIQVLPFKLPWPLGHSCGEPQYSAGKVALYNAAALTRQLADVYPRITSVCEHDLATAAASCSPQKPSLKRKTPRIIMVQTLHDKL